MESWIRESFLVESRTLAPVVQKVDNAIRWINLYPLDSVIGLNPNIYPLDSAIHLLKKKEAWALEFGIQLKEFGIPQMIGIPLTIGIRNPTIDRNRESH